VSHEDKAVALITAAAVASTLALILYGLFAPWWRSVIGRARVAAEFGWVALLDVVLYVHWSHKIVPGWLALTLYAVIAVGAWMWLGAVVEQLWKRFASVRRADEADTEL
jgi:hypothetical protein